jgi:hypothetical protein
MKDTGRRQLIQAFLMLLVIVAVTGTGLLIYFSEPEPQKMVHVEAMK